MLDMMLSQRVESKQLPQNLNFSVLKLYHLHEWLYTRESTNLIFLGRAYISSPTLKRVTFDPTFVMTPASHSQGLGHFIFP